MTARRHGGHTWVAEGGEQSRVGDGVGGTELGGSTGEAAGTWSWLDGFRSGSVRVRLEENTKE